MNNQEYFDQAVTYLLSRRAPAGIVGADGIFRCKYRSPTGPCVVGHFIPDDLYDEQWDMASTDVMDLPDSLSGIAWPEEGQSLAEDLQTCHDMEVNWKPGIGYNNFYALVDVANNYGLDIPQVLQDRL